MRRGRPQSGDDVGKDIYPCAVRKALPSKGAQGTMRKEKRASDAWIICKGLIYATWKGYEEHYIDEFDEKFFEDGQNSDKHNYKV